MTPFLTHPSPSPSAPVNRGKTLSALALNQSPIINRFPRSPITTYLCPGANRATLLACPSVCLSFLIPTKPWPSRAGPHNIHVVSCPLPPPPPTKCTKNNVHGDPTSNLILHRLHSIMICRLPAARDGNGTEATAGQPAPGPSETHISPLGL